MFRKLHALGWRLGHVMKKRVLHETAAKRLPDLDGQYKDLKAIAHTDFSSSFKGVDAVTSDMVFIKILNEARSAERSAVEIFSHEPLILSMINEQVGEGLVVPLIKAELWRGRPYFVQPFMPGWALSKAMKKCAVFNIKHALDILDDCLKRLAAIHSVYIVHGDISPENILIATDSRVKTDGTIPPNSEAWLVDFESAHEVSGAQKGLSFPVIAKAAYLAPEIANERSSLSPQSDLFALGIVLYELLAGTRPYDVQALEDVRLVSRSSIRPMPCEIPKAVRELVSDLIAPALEDRFQSAAEALGAVRHLKDLALAMNETGPRKVNKRLGHKNSRQSTAYIDATSQASVRSEQFSLAWQSEEQKTRAHLTTYAGLQRAGAAPASDEKVMSAPSRPEQTRRIEISTYHGVPIRASAEEDNFVDFSIFAPAKITPGSAFVVDMWAYLPSARDEMLARAVRQHRKVEVGSRGGVAAPLNIQFILFLKMESFTIEKPKASFSWTGNTANASFLITAPRELPAGLYAGTIQVLHNGMLHTELLFEVDVGRAAGEYVGGRVREVNEDDRHIRSAFASYSSKDRPDVLRRVQGMSVVGVDVFVDVLTLRAGQLWEQTLLKNILERDVFYLFWSANASRSEYVEREWRFALNKRGLGFIHPIPLVDPEIVPPPPELNELHFRDIYQMSISGDG